MNFTRFCILTSLLFLSACYGEANSPQTNKSTGSLTLTKTLKGFLNPEAVIYNAQTKHYYVSQTNFDTAKGGGKIARLTALGEIDNLNWVTGLDHPKGMVHVGNKLFVADVTQIVEIDITTNQVVKRYPVKGALFLNDATADKNGNIYVSDTLANNIIRLQKGETSIWVSGDKLNFPNGLKADGDTLYVASWGTNGGKTVDDLMTAKPNGKLLKISLTDKSITELSTALGNLDGLELDGKGHAYISDWVSGKLHRLKTDGTLLSTFDMAKPLSLKSAKGFADILLRPDTNLLFAPMMLNGTVAQLILPSKS